MSVCDVQGIKNAFSSENSLTPSTVPSQLHVQGLTQTEEMLIACALPIMSVYKTRWAKRLLWTLY